MHNAQQRIASLESALSKTAVCLLAAISLLEHGGAKAAGSQAMFRQKLTDYRAAAEAARAVLVEPSDNTRSHALTRPA